jgi:hypothetical protein
MDARRRASPCPRSPFFAAALAAACLAQSVSAMDEGVDFSGCVDPLTCFGYTKNLNFGKPTAYQAPRTIRFSARVEF